MVRLLLTIALLAFALTIAAQSPGTKKVLSNYKEKLIKYDMRQAVRNIDEAKAILQKHKSEVEQRYRVREIGIFGSFARGEQKLRSDVDILVDYNGIPDLFEFINLERYLQHLLKKKVDLVRKPAIRKELKSRILKEVVYI